MNPLALRAGSTFGRIPTRVQRPSIAPAVVLTALALGAINFGLAVLIVAAIGTPTFAPLAAGWLSLALGTIFAAVAIWLWRHYLRGRQEREF